MKRILILCWVVYGIYTPLQAQLVSKVFPHAGEQKVICVMPVNDGYIFLLHHDGSLSSTSRYLVKTDSSFHVVWAKSLNLSGVVDGYNCNLQQLADGGYLLHYLYNAMARFDALGNCLWSTKYTPSFFEAGYNENSQCLEKGNGKIVMMFSEYPRISVLQFSTSGNLEWAKKLDNIALGDEIGIGCKNPGFDMVVLADNTIVVSGKTGSDNCFARMDDAGNVLWSKIIEFDASYSRPYAMEIMEDGNILVSGLRSAKGFFMVMSPVDGSILWQKEANNMVFQDAMSIGNGQYAMLGRLGELEGLEDFPDLGVAVFNAGGELVSSMKIPGITCAAIRPKFKTANGRFYITAVNKYMEPTSVLSLLEFDSTLQFPCVAEPFLVSKIGFTLPAVELGTLNCVNISASITHPPIITAEVPLVLKTGDFCAVFTEEEIEPGAQTQDHLIMDNENFSLNIYEEKGNPDFLIYPNPVSPGETITVVFTNACEYKIELINPMGQLVYSGVGQKEYKLNTAGMEAGVYLLRCADATGRVLSKTIVIQ